MRGSSTIGRSKPSGSSSMRDSAPAATATASNPSSSSRQPSPSRRIARTSAISVRAPPALTSSANASTTAWGRSKYPSSAHVAPPASPAASRPGTTLATSAGVSSRSFADSSLGIILSRPLSRALRVHQPGFAPIVAEFGR